MAKDDLGTRMKGYEAVSNHYLIRRMPVIGRIDGKAFHSLTRGMDKPWDDDFMDCMWRATIALCENIQGCKLAYVQSDEISLLLVDYETLDTQSWFDSRIQKMASVAGSIATAAFMTLYLERFNDRTTACLNGKWPLFDARFWNLPKEEVTNYFVWRQQDATRNSVSGLAQAHFSHKQLLGKSNTVMQEMLFEKGINWNDCQVWQKRGSCAIRTVEEAKEGVTRRSRWVIDRGVPVFTQDRTYIERWIEPAPTLEKS